MHGFNSTLIQKPIAKPLPPSARSSMPSIVLTPHPSIPCEAIRRFEVRLRKMDGGLSLEYSVEGDLASIRIPPPVLPQPTDGLWQATCFEAFFKPGLHSSAYYEFNFAPSAAWAVYRFTAYREGMAAVATIEPPKIVLRQDANRLEMDALVDWDGLAFPAECGECRLGLSAVIEDTQGNRSYWAGAHPPGKPDFHHRDSFAFKLDFSIL